MSSHGVATLVSSHKLELSHQARHDLVIARGENAHGQVRDEVRKCAVHQPQRAHYTEFACYTVRRFESVRCTSTTSPVSSFPASEEVSIASARRTAALHSLYLPTKFSQHIDMISVTRRLGAD